MGQPRNNSMLKSAASALWYYVPLWIFALNAYSIFDMQARGASVLQRALSWTVIFPLIASVCSYGAHTVRTQKGSWKRSSLALGLFFLFLAVLYGLTLARLNEPYQVVDVKLWFEISTGIAFVLFLAHSFSFDGIDRTIAMFAVGFAYGLILENGGIILGFFREEGFNIYLPYLPAPLFTAVGWCNVFYSCRFLALLALGEEYKLPGREKGHGDAFVSLRIVLFSIVITVCALFLDLQLDPFATHQRLWVWDGKLRSFLGEVPLINFSAWISAVFPFAVAFRFLERRYLREGGFSLKLLISIPAVLAAAAILIVALTMIFEGDDSVSLKIFLSHCPLF